MSIIPPTDPNTSSGNDNFNILWLSPDEWLIYSNNKIDQKKIYYLEDKLFNSISKVKLGTVTNVTNSMTIYRNGAADQFDTFSFENGSTEQYSAYKSSGVSGTAGQAGIMRSTSSAAKIQFLTLQTLPKSSLNPPQTPPKPFKMEAK